VYNAGYGGRLSIGELARRIIGLAGSGSEIVHAAERPGDVRHSSASPDRLKALGWRPAHSLDEGLLATMEHFRRIQNQ
jgi:UDP-glucose 4-epimerase